MTIRKEAYMTMTYFKDLFEVRGFLLYNRFVVEVVWNCEQIVTKVLGRNFMVLVVHYSL